MLLAAIAAIAAIFGVYTFLSMKYHNPYTSTFIFGKKGAGKSLWMVREMMRLHKKGWHIYTDMEDVTLPYVRFITLKDLETYQPDPRSAIFLDEVGITMDSRNFKSFPPGLRDFVKYSRKMKVKLYMNSQTYDVDKKVRDTVDTMILLKSIGGFITLVRPIKKRIVLVESSAEAESRIAENLVFEPVTRWGFVYMPHYFKYFNSLSMLTPRPPMPYTTSGAGSASSPDPGEAVPDGRPAGKSAAVSVLDGAHSADCPGNPAGSVPRPSGGPRRSGPSSPSRCSAPSLSSDRSRPRPV